MNTEILSQQMKMARQIKDLRRQASKVRQAKLLCASLVSLLKKAGR